MSTVSPFATDSTAPRDRGRRSLARLSRNRFTAAAAHLALTAVIIGGLCALTLFVWYPHPYSAAGAAWKGLRMLIGTGLAAGPVLTLVVFKPGKRGLRFDLWVIAAVQLAALCYGAAALYRQRPLFTVFAVDRFYLLAGGDIVAGQLADSGLMAAERIGARPTRGPLVVAALLPKDPQAAQRLLDETVFKGAPDIERRPEFWTKYTNATADVIARATPLATLTQRGPQIEAQVDRLTARLGRAVTQLGYLPLVGRDRDLSIVVDLEHGVPLDVIDADPWGTDRASGTAPAR